MDIKYKCTNLTNLRDEPAYMKLKRDTQRDFLILIFVYNNKHLP